MKTVKTIDLGNHNYMTLDTSEETGSAIILIRNGKKVLSFYLTDKEATEIGTELVKQKYHLLLKDMTCKNQIVFES